NHNVVNKELLDVVLASPDFRARAAAARVLCYWRDRVPGALETFKKLAANRHPRVRLEAVRAASFFKEPEAIEVPLVAAEQPTARSLAFTRGETRRVLEPILQKALVDGRPLRLTTDAGARHLIRNLSLARLLALPRNRAVSLELLTRPGVR